MLFKSFFLRAIIERGHVPCGLDQFSKGGQRAYRLETQPTIYYTPVSSKQARNK